MKLLVCFKKPCTHATYYREIVLKYKPFFNISPRSKKKDMTYYLFQMFRGLPMTHGILCVEYYVQVRHDGLPTSLNTPWLESEVMSILRNCLQQETVLTNCRKPHTSHYHPTQHQLSDRCDQSLHATTDCQESLVRASTTMIHERH